MIHVVSLVAFAGVLLYAGLLLVLWRYQERIVFQPPGGVPQSTVPARQVRYRAADGVELFGYLVGDCAAGTRAVLSFHGNADLARWLVPWASEVARRNRVCVMLPEYRGYDGLDGHPTYDGSSRDARAALEYLRNSAGVSPGSVVYFGHSLGSAIAVELASFAAPQALVLQSPFSSARAMGARMYLPGISAFWSLVSRVHFDTMRRVHASDVPVWVAHGDKDFVIPASMGREVFAAARRKGELLIIPRAGHSDVPEVGGEAYWSWLARALVPAPLAATPDAPAETRSVP